MSSNDETAWAGGVCPVDPEAVVFVTFRDGLGSKGRRAKTLRWEHVGECDDIVAYRVLADAVGELKP